MFLSTTVFTVIACIAGSDSIDIPLRVQAPEGYPGNPSSLVKPLRQDLTKLELAVDDKGRATLHLAGQADGPKLGPVDLSWWIPRIPRLAKGEPTLTRIAVAQREFNRNETRFEGVEGCDGLKLANNCLKRGLWEIMLEKKTDTGSALAMHAWFEMPRGVYETVYSQLNGAPYAAIQSEIENYPAFGGFALPLEKLRKVSSETPAKGLRADLESKRPLFSEQKRKSGLLLGGPFEKLGDFAAAAKQPVKTAKFNEPGLYDNNDPMSFDLRWLAHPQSATWRKVEGVQASVMLDEFEVRFENGLRLIVGADGLAALPVREKAPESEKECLRITFGISTPDIYASQAEREKEQSAPRDDYLFLVDKDGKHVDNHTTGVDRAFIWRDAQSFHFYLVGYERIAIVADIQVDAPPAVAGG